MIKTVSPISVDEIRRNREHVAGLNLPRLATLPARQQRLAIVGGGLSALEHLQSILGWDGHVMAINGAYRWLSGHGREPDSVIVVDPLPSMAGLFGDIGDAVFYVADHVDPTVFDAVKNIVTFTNIEGDEDVDGLPGGPTALTRAPVLALYLGYRDITLFGADSCYRGDTTHSYEHKPNPDVFTFSGWETDVQLLAQAQYLAAMWPALERAATVEIVGNHLASRLILGE